MIDTYELRHVEGWTWEEGESEQEFRDRLPGNLETRFYEEVDGLLVRVKGSNRVATFVFPGATLYRLEGRPEYIWMETRL